MYECSSPVLLYLEWLQCMSQPKSKYKNRDKNVVLPTVNISYFLQHRLLNVTNVNIFGNKLKKHCSITFLQMFSHSQHRF
jgi:hypothetical protein